MAQLTCDRLTLGYEGRIVSTDVTFEVSSGDYLCIVGENGSGKSTLIKAILGLKPPMEGRVIWGEGLTRRDIGYLPQQTAAQRDFPASVREIVLSGCLSRIGKNPFYGPAQRLLAEESMRRLQIGNLSRRCFALLSGGQQHRVLLARALCATDRLLVLDEPAAGLDPQITEEMYRMIKELNQSGLSIVMVSHDTQAALKDASHILHLGNTPLFLGTAREYEQSDIGRFYINREAAKA
ncbi:MAG: ATP-binding cassette domain-containing protein [Eubacteriales bacterium]|nr:ATP-binding cassette domain-containing protein [Eubacteriales bacterium]